MLTGSGTEHLMTVSDLSGFLQVPESWVYARTAINAIPHVRVGRYVRFRKSEIVEWLQSDGV